jgi:uncharacterized protein DUF5658
MHLGAIQVSGRGAAGERSVELDLADLLALNILLQIVDGVLTYRALPLGFAEGNPILGSTIAALGPGVALLLFKAKACGLLLLIRWRASPLLVAPLLNGIAVGTTLLAVVPWLGKLAAFAAMTP